MTGGAVELSDDEHAEILRYAAALVARFDNGRAVMPTGESLLQTAIVKIMNADEALARGHASLGSDRIALLPKFRDDRTVQERYSQGLRFWNRERHSLPGFVKLVILSEIRNLVRKQAARSDQQAKTQIHFERQPPSEIRSLEAARFIRSLESAELRGIASDILHHGYDVRDIQFEYGLTRSQAEKRVRRIMQLADAFSSRSD